MKWPARIFALSGGSTTDGKVAAATLRQSRAAAAQSALTPVNFDVPPGACDCHTHIHGDSKRFPFFAGRVYTPPPALPEALAALHRALHIDRAVIVTPSVYGTDNAATLYGMQGDFLLSGRNINVWVRLRSSARGRRDDSSAANTRQA